MVSSRFARRLFAISSLFIMFLAVPQIVKGDTFVQGYKSQGSLTPGRIVQINSNNTVSAAPAKDSTKIFGVVVDPNSSPVALSQNAANQVFVATSGDYNVLISTENGAISAGDYISMSSTDGIGAKAVRGQPTILGRAATAFDGKTSALTSTANYAIGLVSVHVAVSPNPGYNQQTVNGRLKNLATLVSGRNVSPARLYLALAIFVVAFAAASVVLWAGIKGGMTSIGRNPLSRYSVLRGMTQVAVLSILIFIIGLAGCYVALKV